MDEEAQTALEHVIEETNWAYNSVLEHEYMNSDYAEFAGMAIFDFKNALHAPDLTKEELEKMLRGGMSRYKYISVENGWTALMARYMERASNLK